MRATYSAKELLALGFKGLPGTERGIQVRASREKWSYVWDKTQGGHSKRYLAGTLPREIRDAIAADEFLPPAIVAEHKETPQLADEQRRTALRRADLLRLYMKALAAAPWGKKLQARDDFMAAYNSGIAYPELFAALGEVAWKTVESWKKKVEKTGGDAFALADHRGYARRGASALDTVQTDVLLRCVLHPNRPRISEAIRMARRVLKARGLDVASESTARRWLEGWKAANHHIWVFHREGAKAWNDQCAYYIERDYSLINVGDILVADGHTLNFEILNPCTGKPGRMTLIVWKDMKSNYPMGWEIMPTENTAAIASALRRAILRLGKYPKVAYLDNGRAFRAKFFTETANFEEAGIAGIFERLGIETIFAWPYHGQSKTVERFFGTFAELERWCPSYTGTSIERKPPRLMRGEKLHRLAYEKAGFRPLTMDEAHRAIAAWFDEYAARPQRGHLDGRAPAELYLEQRGQGVDELELRTLMMAMEVKHIHRNGISFRGQNYYHPALYGRRHPVEIRYDLQDDTALHVYGQDGSYLCAAEPVARVHPAASVLGTDADRELLAAQIEHKRGQEREAAVLVRDFLEREVLPEHTRHMAALGIEPQAIAPKNGRKALPAPVAQIDEAQLAREVAELAAGQEALDARTLRAELEALDESSRFERIVELEARGQLVCRQYRAFVDYFRLSQAYLSNREYFENFEQGMALLHGTRAAEAHK